MTDFSILFSVDKQHPCYEDHFPGQPIVPGALLLEWISQILLEHYPDLCVSGISSFKFLQPVLPGDVLEINFQLPDDVSHVRVECLRMTKRPVLAPVAKGKFTLAPKNSEVSV